MHTEGTLMVSQLNFLTGASIMLCKVGWKNSGPSKLANQKVILIAKILKSPLKI